MAQMKRGMMAYQKARSGEEGRLQSGMSKQSLGSSIGGGLGTLGMGLYLASLTNPVGWGLAGLAMGASSLVGSTAGRLASGKIGSDYKFLSQEANEAKDQLLGEQFVSATKAGAAGAASAKAELAKMADKGKSVGMWDKGDFLGTGTIRKAFDPQEIFSSLPNLSKKGKNTAGALQDEMYESPFPYGSTQYNNPFKVK